MLALEQVRAMVAFDIIPITEALIKKAKDGDVNAARELFDRAYGKSVQGLGFIDEKGKVLPQPIMNITLAPAPDPARAALHVPSHVLNDDTPADSGARVLSEASSVEKIV